MHLYVCKEAVRMSELLGVLLKPAGHSNAKAFVKPVMHCRPIDVTPESLARGNGFTILGRETSSRRYSSSRDPGIDLRACTRALCGILRYSVGRTFGQKPFLENDGD